jgi:hypothetical protein
MVQEVELGAEMKVECLAGPVRQSALFQQPEILAVVALEQPETEADCSIPQLVRYEDQHWIDILFLLLPKERPPRQRPPVTTSLPLKRQMIWNNEPYNGRSRSLTSHWIRV